MSSEELIVNVVKYSAKHKGDFIMVIDKDEGSFPVCIAPASDRAKAAAELWGFEDDSSGFMAPDDPTDFIKLIPRNWTMEMQYVEEGTHIVQEITLPSSPLVLH